MSTLTKNQHYVWKNYLNQWCDPKGMLHCYRQKERSFFVTNPKNIASNRYFYKMEELSEADLRWIDLVIAKASDPELREFHKNTVKIFQDVFRFRREISNNLSFSVALKNKLSEHIDIMEKMLGERWHTSIENTCQPILEDLQGLRVDFYNDRIQRNHFIHFLMQQFFRTPKLRYLEIRRTHPEFGGGTDLDRTWFIESQIYAMNTSVGIFLEKDFYRFKFLLNDTNTPFIAGDQPIMSLGADGIAVRLYYPLKPTLALIFEKDQHQTLKSERSVGAIEAEYYNNKVCQQSYEQIYATSRDILESTVAIPKDVLAD